MVERLITTEELAQRLGVTPATVIRWAREGNIPEVRLSCRTRRFDYEDVLRAVREREEKGGDE